MEKLTRCQSCGMPLGSGFYGTEADGQQAWEYCKVCYQKGAFTQPDLTVEGMIEQSTDTMIRELQFPRLKAEELSVHLIPQLKRWKDF